MSKASAWTYCFATKVLPMFDTARSSIESTRCLCWLCCGCAGSDRFHALVASRRVTVERVAGGSHIVGSTVNIGCGRQCIAVGATLHVSVIVRENTSIGGIIVTFLSVVIEERCGCKQKLEY